MALTSGTSAVESNLLGDQSPFSAGVLQPTSHSTLLAFLSLHPLPFINQWESPNVFLNAHFKTFYLDHCSHFLANVSSSDFPHCQDDFSDSDAQAVSL